MAIESPMHCQMYLCSAEVARLDNRKEPEEQVQLLYLRMSEHRDEEWFDHQLK